MAAPARQGFFATAPLQPPTVIFELTKRFAADAHPSRVNLGVGAYRDARLAPVVFSAVRKAEALVVAAGDNKEYLPIAGLPAFRAASAELLFGADCAAAREGRVASAQMLSGTGSLMVGAVLLRRLLPRARIFCSDPTWENHGKVVADAGAGGPGGLEYYRYYDAAGCCLDEDGLLADLGAMPEGSVVLLHACAHNPTGVDPTRAQWALILEACRRRRLLPWFDIAYQGFASGDPAEDAWAVRHFASQGMEMLVSQSFAKNMGLYCERVGALHVVAADAASAAAALSNVEAIVRPMYSNPPAHGARIVAKVLGSAELRAEWLAELAAAMQRVMSMRKLLRAAVERKGTPGTWGHITAQIGLFSFTGLTVAQSESMTNDYHIYMLNTGRINVAGLNEEVIDYVASSIHAVVTGAVVPAAAAKAAAGSAQPPAASS